jgi:5'-nucleotidase
VYVALMAKGKVLPRWPDLVVSGLNHGMNLGSDVFYSGTVAAAREAALRNVPAVATSADLSADRDAAAEICARIALEVLRRSAPRPVAPLINVNVPPGSKWPVVGARLGARLYDDVVEFRVDPRGREYLWIGGGGVRHRPVPGSDTEAYDRGAVSITSLLLDLTAGADADLCGAVASEIGFSEG